MALPRSIRADHRAIASRVPDRTKVLDVGCGDGTLLSLLKSTKLVDARGLELSAQEVGQALARGLSVVQGDADIDLEIFPDDAFDIAILSKTIQQMRRPAHVLQELSRIAPEVILSFRNYGLWSRRLTLLKDGRMPGTRVWHDEAALHPSTSADMIELTDSLGMKLIAAAPVNGTTIGEFRNTGLQRLNWSADEVILHLGRKG